MKKFSTDMNIFEKFSFPLLLLFFFIAATSPNLKSLADSPKDNQKDFSFNKNLKIGDSDEDVRILQAVLNKNPATQVALYGAGSPGNETNSFGQLTKNAIVKFQELYDPDILRPFGLTRGTGFVGIATRLKLNSLLKTGDNKIQVASSAESAKNISSKGPSKSNQSAAAKSGRIVSSGNKSASSAVNFLKTASSTSNRSAVRVYNTSEYQVLPGGVVDVQGEGFAPNLNIVHIGDGRLVENISASDSSKLSFTVPKDLPLGKYDIWVTNENGTSKNDARKIFLVVSDKPAERPLIEKVEPSAVGYEDEITVYGKGFTANGNGIYSIFGNISDIASSDGKTLKFKPSSMPKILKLNGAAAKMKDNKFTIWFYVVNENGYNKEAASFTVKL